MKYARKQRNGGWITTTIGHTNPSGMYHRRNTKTYPDPIKLKNEYLSKLLNAVENGEAYISSSGIIVTSSLPNDNYTDPAVFLDSTLGEIHKLPKPYTRHDIPYSTDTLKCDSKNYLMDIWLIKDEPNWMKKEDTLNRLDLKLSEACIMTRQ